MDYYKVKLIRKLKSESKEVQEELLYVESTFNEAALLFCSSVDSFCRENSLKNPLESLDSNKKNNKSELTDGIKSVFRKIAIQTHPDKHQGDNETEVNYYHDVTAAKKVKDASKIFSIAKELKIETNELGYSDIKIIEKSIQDTRDKINKMMTSYPWLWFFSSNDKRPHIIHDFIKNQV